MHTENIHFTNASLGRAANSLIDAAMKLKFEVRSPAAFLTYSDAIQNFLDAVHSPLTTESDRVWAQGMAEIAMRWANEANGTILH